MSYDALIVGAGLADDLDGVHFLGRLAQYAYLNMDQMVGRTLALYDGIRTSD
jgi:UDP-galactopyranose mutase